jgi:glucose/arabinose dehydrogenase
MLGKYRLHSNIVVIGLLMLLMACNPARSTAPPTAAQPGVPADETSSPSAQSALTPTATQRPAATIPTPTFSPQPVESTAVSAMPSASPQTSSVVPPTPSATIQATPPPFPPAIGLESVFSGFEAPVYLAHAGEQGDGASRLFVVEKAGRIRLIKAGTVQPQPFLDISERVGSQGSEQGLLSVAFPPDYAGSGDLYVDYTDQQGNTVVARYQLLAGNPDQADPNSEQKILQIEQPAANHNGGQLQFGPDGYLYVGMGDGGAAGDPWGNAQKPGALLGKLLRINVTDATTYTVPASNPLLGQSGARPEIWALGLRNPWRFSFDQGTGDLYIADVGQNTYEEIDFQPANSPGGQNYGWNIMEGEHCFQPQTGCDTGGLVLPVTEYDHGQGCSVTGGYVYRGTRYPELSGTYFFGDYCSGNIWGLRHSETGEWQMALLLTTNLNISSFGVDSAGEIYVVGYREGTIYRLISSK